MSEEGRKLHVTDFVEDTLTAHRGGILMTTKLARISEIARENKSEKFTSLCHLLNKELLLQSHDELASDKATGIDKVTKEEYEENLEENIEDLIERLKKFSYRPKPVKRVYIDKGKNEKRPLGIPAYEDKIVQLGLKKVLESIYEVDFLDCSYGFRPEKSCHDALKELNNNIENGKISYVVDADIKGYFDNINHEWLMKFISHRIKDPNIKRLIVRFLKAGVMKEGVFSPTEKGTPQGGIISPLLANIYLHYTLDTWFVKVVEESLQDQTEIVRYADDYVCCFQKKKEAYKFYEVLQKRLAKFGLELAEEKSEIVGFGRFAEERIKKNVDRSKPETFNFLGFTHYCSNSRYGKFRVKRRTSKKKYNEKINKFKEWIKQVRNKLPKYEIMKKVRKKLTGHYRYYGITDNIKMLKKYKTQIEKLIIKWLNNRSQKKSFNLKEFYKYLKLYPLPKPRIYVNIYN